MLIVDALATPLLLAPAPLREIRQRSTAPVKYMVIWPKTLDTPAALRARALVPRRGPMLIGAKAVRSAIASTRQFLVEMYAQTAKCARKRASLEQAFDAACALQR